MNGKSAPSSELLGSWRRRRSSAIASCVRSGMPAAIRLGGAFLQLLATVMIARALGSRSSGEFFFWSSVLMSLGQVSTFGLDRLALRQLPRMGADGAERRRFLATVRSAAVALALAVAVPVVVYAVLTRGDQPRQLWWYALLPACILGVALCMINGEAMIGSRQPVLGIIYRHTLTAVLFIASLVALRPVLSHELALLCFTFAFLAAGFGAMFGPGYRGRGPHFAIPERSEFLAHLKLGAPICLGSVFAAMCYVIPLAILERTRPTEEVAFLSTSYRLFLLFEILSLAVHSLSMPDLSVAIERGDRAGARRVYRTSLVRGFLVLGLPILAVTLFSGEVMALFGEDFGAEAATVLSILMLFSLGSLLLGPASHRLLMTGRTDRMALFAGLRLALVVIAAVCVVPSWGPMAMAMVIGAGILAEKAACLYASSSIAPRPGREPLNDGNA